MEHRGWEKNQVLGRYLVWHIPLAVQFWPIYSVCNELNKSVNEVWDGQCLKLSFRRNFSDSLMEQWFQLEEIDKSITFTAEPDALIW